MVEKAAEHFFQKGRMEPKKKNAFVSSFFSYKILPKRNTQHNEVAGRTPRSELDAWPPSKGQTCPYFWPEALAPHVRVNNLVVRKCVLGRSLEF